MAEHFKVRVTKDHLVFCSVTSSVTKATAAKGCMATIIAPRSRSKVCSRQLVRLRFHRREGADQRNNRRTRSPHVIANANPHIQRRNGPPVSMCAIGTANGSSRAATACCCRSRTRPPSCWPVILLSACSTICANSTTIFRRFYASKWKRTSDNRRRARFVVPGRLMHNPQGSSTSPWGWRQFMGGVIWLVNLMPQGEILRTLGVMDHATSR